VEYSNVEIKKLGNFEILYHTSDSYSANKILNFVNQYSKDFNERMGYKFEHPVKIFIASSEKEFNELTNHTIPDWGEAVADTKNKIIVLKSTRFSKNKQNFEEVVLHELSHIGLAETLKDSKPPRWFDEGLAMYLSKFKMDWDSNITLSQALVSRKIFELEEVDKVMNFKRAKAQLLYAESYSAVSFIAENFGEETLKKIIQEFSQNKNFNEAFINSTGIDFLDFEVKWFQYIKHEYKWYWLLNIEIYIWMIGIFLFLLIYTIVKIRNRKILKRWEEEEKTEDETITLQPNENNANSLKREELKA
jgi:hypothetical protein